MHMKKLSAILVLAAALLGLTYLVKPGDLRAPATSQTQNTQPVVSQNYVKYYGQEGSNALQLLQALTPVQVREYSFGAMVQGINGVVPDSKHFWELYINGSAATVGADQLQTRPGDIIEWKLSEIKSGE